MKYYCFPNLKVARQARLWMEIHGAALPRWTIRVILKQHADGSRRMANDLFDHEDWPWAVGELRQTVERLTTKLLEPLLSGRPHAAIQIANRIQIAEYLQAFTCGINNHPPERSLAAQQFEELLLGRTAEYLEKQGSIPPPNLLRRVLQWHFPALWEQSRSVSATWHSIGQDCHSLADQVRTNSQSLPRGVDPLTQAIATARERVLRLVGQYARDLAR